MTVAGGLRRLEDVRDALRSGADKVAINTAAVARPELIREVSLGFGSQCMVLSIQTKKIAPDRWEAYTDNGRERSGRDALEWACQGVELGAGELLVTSMDRDGTKDGYDLQLIRRIADSVPVPVIASGGVGTLDHLVAGVSEGHADAVLAASIFHYGTHSITEARAALAGAGIPVRGVKNVG
jgi:cyclase